MRGLIEARAKGDEGRPRAKRCWPAELGARRRVRKRDVSFGPRTAEGGKAWDTFMTLAATAAKLGVSFYAYVHDRLSTANQIPGLDRLIAARAETLNLGPSWNTS